jgi:hypothetical protein
MDKIMVSSQNEILYKVVTFVNREELDFLDNLVKDMFFSKGRKIPRSQMAREIIQLAMQLKNFSSDIAADLAKKSGLTQEPPQSSDVSNKDSVAKRRVL